MTTLAQLERMRDIVAEHAGKLEIRFYVPAERNYFLISHCDGETAYRMVMACGGDQRETFEKTWPSRMLDVVLMKGVSARLKFDGSPPEWFDTAEDSQAFDKLYHRVMQLARRPRGGG